MIDHDAEGTDCCGKGISDLTAERFAGCVCCFEPVMISYKYQNVRRAVYALL